MKELEKELENYLPQIPEHKPVVIGEEKPQGYAGEKHFPDVEPKVLGEEKPQLGYVEKKVDKNYKQ